MRYSTVLFDLDHTLFDSDQSESTAFSRTIHLHEAGDPESIIDTYQTINRQLWAAVERGEIDATEVRTRRFERLVRTAGIDTDPLAMSDTYVSELGASGDLYPGAREEC